MEEVEWRVAWKYQIGTQEEGKIADIVQLRTNTLEDISSLQDPENAEMVLKDGKVVYSKKSQEVNIYNSSGTTLLASPGKLLQHVAFTRGLSLLDV